MRSYNFFILLDFNLASLRRSGKGNDDKGKATAPPLSRKRDLFLAFVIVSLPLLVIAVLLLTYTFNSRENPTSYVEIPVLPFLEHPSTDAFYASVDSGSFLLLGSWASNVAAIIVAPFMVLFSYAVAQELQHEEIGHEDTDLRPPLLREIMRGAHVGVWHWVGQNVFKKRTRTLGKRVLLRAVDVAGLGLFVATLLAIMVIVGDNWLHATTQSILITHYYDPTNYTYNQEQFNATTEEWPQGGFSITSLCDHQLTAALPQNVSTAPLPCSLNRIDGLDNVANPQFVYLTLGTGISQVSSNFNDQDFTSLDSKEQEDTATAYQVVTYQPPEAEVSHSLLFYPDAAAEYTDTADGVYNQGIDYVAGTTSMATQCTYVTQECGVHSTGSTDGNNVSTPFNCYPDFAGNLGQTPATGHERAQGWNMSFYQLVNGTPTNIPVQAQSNPFSFYVATAVNSIQLADFKRHNSELPEGNPQNGSLVDDGQGFTAFALSCEATIYDVTFSIINGSFWDFNASISSPQKASIIQAPLQVGFGQYHLYEAASTAVLAKNTSVAISMGKAFSQTGMALASGVFNLDNNIEQRYRAGVQVTKVLKAPLLYLVVVCLVYSVFGMVMTVLALLLRRRPEVRDQQKRLMVEWGPDLQGLDLDTEKGEGGKGRRKEGDELKRSSSVISDILG